jgi:hypothetical protein
MPLSQQELAERIKRGPSYLLLGQAWLKSGTGHDAFLEQGLRKFASGNIGEASYTSLFNTTANVNQREAVEWLHNRCNAIPIPEAFETINELAWNGVVTSAIDDVLIRGLRKPWRDVQRVTEGAYQPTNPRSRAKLNVWCLFGNVSASEPSGWPPLTKLQFVQRKGTATVLANGLPELLTSLGTLCIEGYELSNDWLSNEALYQIIANLDLDQTHLFSANESHRNDTYFRTLADEGKLTFHNETLAQFLSEAADAGWISLGQTLAEADFGKSLRIAGRSIEVPEHHLRQIQTTGRIITELAFAPLKPQSRDARYADFRNFLYQSSYHPDWEGYARGFAFKRPFQAQLFQTVRNQIESPSIRGEPVVVHGPTGSGKTVALGQLAFELQKEGKCPVVFIDRNVRQIRRDLIDQFCIWAEEQGSHAVVIIWDGMQETREYRRFNQFLRSRGRRSVLVGSCYQTDVAGHELPNAVHVRPSMETEEWKQFQIFLGTIDPDLPARFVRLPGGEPETFLGSLYRYLPETRGAIQAGLGLEVAHAEDFLLHLKIPAEQGTNFGNSLVELLANAGLHGTQETFGEEAIQLGGESANEIRRLIGFIMLPGRFGLSTPFELLIRTLGRSSGMRLLPILERVDIFRISEDTEGNPSVGPRSALEANLINRRLMGGAKSEVDYAVELLSHVRGSHLTGQREIDFAVDLLRFLGPNGQDAPYYNAQFETMAQCLHRLRSDGGLKHTRLMLQESVLFREAAKLQQKSNPQASQKFFERAIDASSEALQMLEIKPATRQMRCQLLVEAAAAFGSQARSETDPHVRFNLVEKAHQKAFAAYAADPSTFHPLDVVIWTANDLLKSEKLSEIERLTIIEAVTYAFALTESEDWDFEANVVIERRRVELEQVVGEEVAKEAFQKLLNLGSAAGVVLRAYQLAGGLEAKKLPREERGRLAMKALDFMNTYSTVVFADSRALYLRFKLWWRMKTGIDFNEQERFPIPFKREDWDECVNDIGRFITNEDFQTNLTLRLIEAVAFFHRGEYRRGFEAFEQLNAEQIFARNRVFRRYIFSDESGNGKPRRFSGTVTHVRDGKEGLISIPRFPKGITFFVRDTGRPDLRQGDDLNDFCIAFNMLGPIADFRI